jgi:hypothetical protein
MPVSRLFVEVGKDIDRMNESLRQAMTVADQAGIKVSGAGKTMIASFNAALNPTKALAEQVKLLETVGKSSSEIWSVMSDRMKAAATAAQNNKQAIDPLVQKYLELGKTTQQSAFSFEGLGKSIQEFAADPLHAAGSGITGLLGTMGPTAVGIGALATGFIAAGVAAYKFTEEAAHAAEGIKNLSYATGLSAEEVQALQRMGEERGLGDLTGVIEKLNIQLGSDKGGDFVEALLRMGIAIKQNQSAIPYLEQLREHYTKMTADIGANATAQQAAADLGRRLIGTVGPLVLNANESITESMDGITKSGAVMANAEIDQLAKLNTKLEEHGRFWASLSNKIKTSWGLGVGVLASDSFWKNFLASGMNQYQAASQTLKQMLQETKQATEGKANEGKKPGEDQAPKENELVRRARIIADADAIAANTRQELIGLTRQLNDLEKQFSVEKGKENSTKWDEAKVTALARQISYTKQLIRDSEEYASTRGKEIDDYIKAEKHAKDLTQEIKQMQDSLETAAKIRYTKGGQEVIDLYLKKFDKEQFENIKAYADFQKELDKAIASADMEHLRAQSRISDTIVTRGEASRILMEIQKAHERAEIEAEEVKLRYAQQRANLEAQIAKMAPGSDQRKAAEGELNKLKPTKNTALDDISAQLTASVKKTAGEMDPFAGTVENYKKMLKEIAKLRASGDLTEKQSFQLKAKATYEAYQQQLGFASDFFGQLAQLSRSHNKTMAAIGKAAAIAQATIEGLKAVMNALGAYPPPYSFIMAGVVGAMAAVNIAKIASVPAGYAKGGLVSGGLQNITVNEQGPEFVVNSRATRDFMPLLMAMNSSSRSAASSSAPDFSGLAGAFQRPNMNVTVQNFGTSKDFEVQQVDEETIRVIARDEARTAVNRYGPEVIASDMTSANSRTSKAIQRNTTARRAR